MLKRYLVFGYDAYYPSGGASEVVGDFDTFAEVLNHIKAPKEQPGYPPEKAGKWDEYDVLDLVERRWVDQK